MKLYDYYRSTACYRVRIALKIKNISYETLQVHLTNQGGEHHRAKYLAINPQGLVPTLDDDGQLLSQSIAIIEYLDEINPISPLLPATPFERAEVRSLALTIACDMHPLNNLRVLERLRQDMKATEEQIKNWYHHWLKQGFDSLEKRLQSMPRSGKFSYGSEASLADICLIPQVYNAHRFDFSMADYPVINEINTYCLGLKAFKEASP